MVDGRIGNKLALLALKQLMTSESLIKVDMLWGDCWCSGIQVEGNEELGGTGTF